MSEIRETEVDFLSFPEGLAGGDEEIMSVLSLRRQVRSWIDTELLVSLNFKVHIHYAHLQCGGAQMNNV